MTVPTYTFSLDLGDLVIVVSLLGCLIAYAFQTATRLATLQRAHHRSEQSLDQCWHRVTAINKNLDTVFRDVGAMQNMLLRHENQITALADDFK